MPLIERLERIFQVRLGHDRELAATVGERFLSPIFALARVYDDTLPALARLRRAGIRAAIVSNAPWGSPPDLWRRELEHLGLAGAVDAVILCGDGGWRKPAPEIFRAAMHRLSCRPSECVFVGDDLRWDVEGSASVGMRPVLIDREARYPEYAGERIRSLEELLALIGVAE